MIRATSWVVAVMLAGLLAAEEADVLLKDGRRLHGDVTETPTHVIIRTPAGELPPIPREDVLRVIPRSTPDGEYERRVRDLRADDVAGHFAVAEWARSIERWDLVARQCRLILQLDPEHRNARVLLAEASARLADSANEQMPELPAEDESETGEAEPGSVPRAPLMSESDVKRLKLFELSFTGPPERLRVRFLKQRGVPDVERRFVEEMRSRNDDAHDERWERAFLSRRPEEQLLEIVSETGAKYADQIEISGDPRVFETFRRRVLPLVVRGCATTGCHGASGAVFSFPRGARQSDAYAYTVFYLLDSIDTQFGPLINRDDPRLSVLLSFMLPREGNDRAHPESKRRTRFRPVVRSRDERDYNEVLEWISSLALPRPDYGLAYELPATIRVVPRAETPRIGGAAVDASEAQPGPTSAPAASQPVRLPGAPP